MFQVSLPLDSQSRGQPSCTFIIAVFWPPGTWLGGHISYIKKHVLCGWTAGTSGVPHTGAPACWHVSGGLYGPSILTDAVCLVALTLCDPMSCSPPGSVRWGCTKGCVWTLPSGSSHPTGREGRKMGNCTSLFEVPASVEAQGSLETQRRRTRLKLRSKGSWPGDREVWIGV